MAAATPRCPGPSLPRTHRRDLLRFGLTGLGSLGLTDLCAHRAEAAPGADRSDTAVILVYCHGGPSHLETFDPKPDAPAEYRGPFGAIETSLPGLRYSELLPRTAKLAHKTSLVRSVHHRAPCHDSGPQTLFSGHEVLVNKFEFPDHPDAFCILSKVREREGNELPVYVGAPPLGYSGPAYLGPGYAPFAVTGDPNQPTFEVPNVGLAEGSKQRLGRRLRLLSSVDDVRRDLERDPDVRARDRHYHAAVDLLTSNRAREAFDISREDVKTRERYGRNRWGQQLLLARRLVEAGVSAVTTSLYAIEGSPAGSWDDHAVNCDIFKAYEERSPVFDRAVAALIEDLYDRGLDKRVLVLVMGEFGRTPKISYFNGRPGRDHWPAAQSILFVGGGMRMGQVVGATDSLGEHPSDRPLQANDFLATVYWHLGVDTRAELRDRSNRPFAILDRSEPIRELV